MVRRFRLTTARSFVDRLLMVQDVATHRGEVQKHERPMAAALAEAERAALAGEVPVGAVVVEHATGRIVARAHNLTEAGRDATAHAELLAIRAASDAIGTARLSMCDLYVTLEPCAMCAGAIVHARLRRLYFGAYDPKGGGVEHGARVFERSTTHHRPDVYGGIDESRSRALLQTFFRDRR